MVIFGIVLESLTVAPGPGEQGHPALLPITFQMFILRTQWALLAILLNKLIATLHAVDFFFLLKRVDYYSRKQRIIICGPNLKTSPSLRREANKRRALLLWPRQKSGPKAQEFKMKGTAQDQAS